jgi:hypothetical protein
MRRQIFNCIILVISLHTACGMYEFDELAHRIVDNVKTGRTVSPEFIEEWYESDPPHVKSVIDEFHLSSNEQTRALYLEELLKLLDENLAPDAREKLHQLLDKVSTKNRDGVFLLLFNYVCGIPQ